MSKKIVAALGRSMTEAAERRHSEGDWTHITDRIETAINAAVDDLLRGRELVEAGARRAVSDAIEDDWIDGTEDESRLTLSRRLLNNRLRYAHDEFEDRAALYLALAKELKRLRRRIPAIARRAPGGMRQDESVKKAIARAAVAGNAEAQEFFGWLSEQAED